MPLGASKRAVTTYENLNKAWLWTKTSGDRAYKLYFRNLYRAFSLCEADALASIRYRLLHDAYEPCTATKLYFPKPSGILRPFTLLSVEDQIVYQAFANVIAERLVARVGHRYNRAIFGHLYAGKASTFFYTNWRHSYRLYTLAMRRAFAAGYRYTASFDLTACYDTIDHAVLTHFLRDLKLDKELCEDLCVLLSHWTEASGRTRPLYHGHGIPQGPQPSGLLAECVLRYFDDAKRPQGVRYFRYVDDIRLFAQDEDALRKELVRLDIRSKEIGLFPQGGKIDIHRIVNIDAEIKSVSIPPEPSIQGLIVDQRKVEKRLVQLSPRMKVTDSTRFKYVLAMALPNATLAKRLLRVVRNQPHMYEPVFRHLAKARRLSKATSKDCLALLHEQALYPAFTAAMIRAIRGSIHSAYVAELHRYCRSRITRNGGTQDPELRAAAGALLLRDNLLTWKQTVFNVNWRRNWWVRTELLPELSVEKIGEPNLQTLCNVLLRDESTDVSLVATEVLLRNRLTLQRPVRTVNTAAQWALKQAGVIGKVSTTTCPIISSVVQVLGPALRPIRWREVFSPREYRLMIRRFSLWRAYAGSDPTAWVALSDVINDVVLHSLFLHDGTIGQYTLGKMGSVLHAPTSGFALKYPKVWTAASVLHASRLEADIVHSVTKTTNRPTRRITYREVNRLKKVLSEGYWELWSSW